MLNRRVHTVYYADADRHMSELTTEDLAQEILLKTPDKADLWSRGSATDPGNRKVHFVFMRVDWKQFLYLSMDCADMDKLARVVTTGVGRASLAELTASDMLRHQTKTLN